MPTYQFRCMACNHIQEQFTLKMSKLQVRPCDKCKSCAVQAIFSPPNIIFKGKGFYKTDNRSQ